MACLVQCMCNVCVYTPAPIYSNACTHRKPADPGHNEKCMFLQCRIRCVCVSAGLHAASYHQWALPVGTDLSQYRLLFGRLQQEHKFDIQRSRMAHSFYPLKFGPRVGHESYFNLRGRRSQGCPDDQCRGLPSYNRHCMLVIMHCGFRGCPVIAYRGLPS